MGDFPVIMLNTQNISKSPCVNRPGSGGLAQFQGRPELARRVRHTADTREEDHGALIDIRVRPQILENLLPPLLVNHQIDAIAAMPALQPSLGLDEGLVEALPVAPAASLADLAQMVLPILTQTLQQRVLQRQEELTAPGVALPTGTADELTVDSQGLVPLGARTCSLPAVRIPTAVSSS
jgi:hypothetical protein